jgi:hypothetical protein
LIAFDAEIVKLKTQIPSFDARENLFVAIQDLNLGAPILKNRF